MQQAVTRSSSIATDREVFAEQIRLLYRHFTFMSLANIPSVLVFAYILSGQLGWSYSAPWTAALLCSILLRVRLTRAFEKAGPDDSGIVFWARQAVRSTLLSGILWSVLPPLGAYMGLHTFLVLSFLVSLMATVFVAPGSTYRPAFFSFSVPIVCSVAFSFIFLMPQYWYAGVAMLFGLAIMVNLSKHYHRTLLESIKIRFENRALIEQLTAQKLEAEHANQSKSRFLAAASHDLRQPLHALNLYFDALELAQTEERRRNLTGKISVAINTLNSLFDRLLDISRLDAGVVVPSIERCALNEIFDHLHVHFLPLAAEKQLQLKLEHNNLYVRSDCVLLQQMLDNLVSNAIRYTDKGTVEIDAVQRDGKVTISVRDTGRGIPYNEQQNIFNEFYQLDNPERDHRKGLGLGLSIVKRLCQLTGHQINIRSTPGSGTECQLHFQSGPQRTALAEPAGNADRDRSYRNGEIDNTVREAGPVYSAAPGRPVAPGGGTGEDAEPPQGPAAAHGVFRGVRVLIVDDDADIRDAMHERLSNWACQTASAESVQQARQVVSSGFSPVIVLADYRLRNGQTGVQAIQVVEEMLDRPVGGILITGDTAAGPLKRAAQSGYRLLHKPVRADQLYAFIAQWVPGADPDPKR